MLRIYKISGSTATPYAVYGSQTNFVLISGSTDSDWVQWSGFALPLAANTTYAYTFGRLSTGFGYANLSNVSGDLYPNGEVVTIGQFGGAFATSSTAGYDGTFDLGLTLGTGPIKIGIQNIGGGQLQLTWPSGILLQATSLNGPWTTNVNTSPYTFTPTGAQKFYRVQVP
jgi:hypothetical protein